MDRVGLVFAGGGGKGAYQIGVWKYLKECGLDKYICAVSGTSVGALNAVLFTACDYTVAENIWLNIKPEQILTPRKVTIGDIIRSFVHWGICLNIPKMLIGAAMIKNPAFIKAIRIMLVQRHGFSREGLLDIMNKNVNFSNLQEADIPCYATCFNIAKRIPERFELSKFSEKEMQAILLASSAMPVIFKPVRVRDAYYWDGGLPLIGDNVPIQPLYDAGVKNIIVVHLSRDVRIDREKYKDAKMIEIIPQVDLGNLIDGTLDFTRRGSVWRIEQGYKDAKRIFSTLTETT